MSIISSLPRSVLTLCRAPFDLKVLRMKEKRLTKIEEQLTNAFHPKRLIVTDESRYHQGHQSAEGKGHFSVSITTKAFNNKTLLERHRLIYKTLGDLMKTDIHALKICAVCAVDES